MKNAAQASVLGFSHHFEAFLVAFAGMDDDRPAKVFRPFDLFGKRDFLNIQCGFVPVEVDTRFADARPGAFAEPLLHDFQFFPVSGGLYGAGMEAHHGEAVLRKFGFQRQHAVDGFGVDVGQVHADNAGRNGAFDHVGAVGVEFMGVQVRVGIDEVVHNGRKGKTNAVF